MFIPTEPTTRVIYGPKTELDVLDWASSTSRVIMISEEFTRAGSYNPVYLGQVLSSITVGPDLDGQELEALLSIDDVYTTYILVPDEAEHAKTQEIANKLITIDRYCRRYYGLALVSTS